MDPTLRAFQGDSEQPTQEPSSRLTTTPFMKHCNQQCNAHPPTPHTHTHRQRDRAHSKPVCFFYNNYTYYIKLCYTMLYCTILRLYDIIRLSTTLCSTILSNPIHYTLYTVHSTLSALSSILYMNSIYYTTYYILYTTNYIVHTIQLYYTPHTTLHYATLHYTTLHYTTLR